MSLGRMWGRGVGGSHPRQLAESEIREKPRVYAEGKVQRVHTQRKMFYSIAIFLLSVCSVSECYIIKQLNGKLCRLTSSPPGPLHCVANGPFTSFFKLPLNVNVSVNVCSSQGTRFLRGPLLTLVSQPGKKGEEVMHDGCTTYLSSFNCQKCKKFPPAVLTFIFRHGEVPETP